MYIKAPGKKNILKYLASAFIGERHIKNSRKRWLTCLSALTECHLNPFVSSLSSKLEFKPNAFVICYDLSLPKHREIKMKHAK